MLYSGRRDACELLQEAYSLVRKALTTFRREIIFYLRAIKSTLKYANHLLMEYNDGGSL